MSQPAQYNLDSASFNVNSFFKHFVKNRSLVEVIEKNN